MRILFGALVCVLAVAFVACDSCALASLADERDAVLPPGARSAAAPDGATLDRIAGLERGSAPWSKLRARPRYPRRRRGRRFAGLPRSAGRRGSPSGALHDRWCALETAVLRGLGYSFDAPPEPAVIDALLDRPFAAPRHRHGVSAYSPEQLLGPPDSQAGASSQNAWCSLEPDSGFEWIEAHFEARDAPRAVLVRETSAPGAVVQIEAEE